MEIPAQVRLPLRRPSEAPSNNHISPLVFPKCEQVVPGSTAPFHEDAPFDLTNSCRLAERGGQEIRGPPHHARRHDVRQAVEPGQTHSAIANSFDDSVLTSILPKINGALSSKRGPNQLNQHSYSSIRKLLIEPSDRR